MHLVRVRVCECRLSVSVSVSLCVWVCIINALYDHLACHLLTAPSQTKRTQYTHNLPSSYSQYSIYPITSTLTRLCVNFESTIWHYNYVSNHPVNRRTAQRRLQELHQYKAFSYCSQRLTEKEGRKRERERKKEVFVVDFPSAKYRNNWQQFHC